LGTLAWAGRVMQHPTFGILAFLSISNKEKTKAAWSDAAVIL
jgi:hypothetical protein